MRGGPKTDRRCGAGAGRAATGASALAVCAVVLSACGGASRPASTGSSASKPTGGLRWLVRTGGPAPTVVQENARPGTRAWRLPGPPDSGGGVARGPVEGYVAEQAVAPGQSERIYVRAPGARSVRVDIYRMGWYGGLGGRLVARSTHLPVDAQPPCAHRSRTGLTECRWHPTLTFTVPAALPSGVYIAKLSAGAAQRDCLFVVRESRAPPAPVLMELPTASYEAYNAWGGDSLYPGGARPVGLTASTQGVEVSYDRPYDSITGAGQFFARDVASVRFLERYGYSVAYTTIESIDSDPGQVQGRRAILDVGHSEYWSQGAAQALGRAIDHGTSVLFLSSDTLAWRVRFAPATRASSEGTSAAHRIESYKEHVASDPVHSPSSGAFPSLGAALTGSAYNGCITPRIARAGPPTYRYYAWAPAPGLQPAWLFAGTHMTAATRIAGIVGYELDQRTPDAPPGTTVVGGGTATCMSGPGVTGHEAQSTLYATKSGATVFATGTLGWELALYPVADASPDAPHASDARVVRMTMNVLAHAGVNANGSGAG